MKQKSIFLLFGLLLSSSIFCQSIEWYETSYLQAANFHSDFVQTSGNNVFTAGNFNFGIDFHTTNLTTNNYQASFYLANYDTLGSLKWAIKGGKDDRADYLKDMKVDQYDNVYLIGEFTDSLSIGNFTLLPDCPPYIQGPSKTEGFLIKIDPLGNVMWGRVFYSPNCSNLGTSKPAYLSIADSSIYTLGSFSRSISVSNSNLSLTKNGSNVGEYYVSRFDLNGNLNFLEKVISASPSTANTSITDLEAKNDSVYYLTGFFSTNHTFGVNARAFTSPLSTNQALVLSYKNDTCAWLLQPKDFGNINAGINRCLVTKGANDELFLAGTFNYNVIFHGDTLISSTQTGLHTSWFVVKLNQDGTVSKTRTIGINGYELIDFTASRLSEVTLVGSFQDSIIYLDSTKVLRKSNRDVLVYAVDSLLNYKWHLNEAAISAFEIASSNTYSHYVFGGYNNTITLGQNTINGPGVTNHLLFKLTSCDSFTANYSIGNDVILSSVNSSITLDAGQSNNSFLWSDGSSNSTFTLTYNAAKSGTTDTVFVSALSPGNCSLKDTVLVQYDISTSSFENELFSGDFNIYPNPFSESVNLFNSINESVTIQLEIYSSSGKLVYSEKEVRIDPRSTYQVNLNSFSTGIYFIKIHSEKGILFKKLIKQ